jgi:hypothetical protein
MMANVLRCSRSVLLYIILFYLICFSIISYTNYDKVSGHAKSDMFHRSVSTEFNAKSFATQKNFSDVKHLLSVIPIPSKAIGLSSRAYETVWVNDLKLRFQSRNVDNFLRATVQSILKMAGLPAPDECFERSGIHTLLINVEDSSSETVNHIKDEAYELLLSPTDVRVFSPSVWGALHAARTFAQLIVMREGCPSFLMPHLLVEDIPRFVHRGFLLDTAHHYKSPSFLRRAIFFASFFKYNCFHWHITDHQSFGLQLPSYPRLAAEGGMGVGGEPRSYSQQQVGARLATPVYSQ